MKPSLKLIPALISGTLLSGFGLAAEKSPVIHYLPEAQDVVQNKNDAGAVLSWLRQHAKALGIDAVVDQLQLRQTKHSLTGTHYHFQQQINGIPVWRSEVVVSVIQSRTQKAASSIRVFNNSVAVPAEIPVAKSIIDQQQALALAWSNLQSSGDLLAAPKAEMAYLVRGKQLQLVYVTSMYLNQPYGEWQQLVDAKSGEVIAVERTDLPTFKNANSEAPDGKWRFAENKQARDFAQVMQAFQQRQAAKQAMAESTASKADATALVFDPDPRTTLNDATLEDNSPAARFEGAYQTRTLRDVTVQNGVYSLKGPWVTIENFEAGAQGSVETPSTTTDGNWTAKRGDSAFNDVMTYFHLDQNQRYIQSLGFSGTKGIQELSISVDANGVDGADNSHFIPSSNKLAFGWGCVDDNEDTDVILHEYGHAINYAINNYWSGGDTGAMG
jgi:hypothetical protein